jgi:hypothetical protein
MTCTHCDMIQHRAAKVTATLCTLMCRIQILLFVRQHFLQPIVWLRGCEVQMNAYEKTVYIALFIDKVVSYNYYYYIQFI